MASDIMVPKGTDDVITRMVGNKDAILVSAESKELNSAYWDGGSKSSYVAYAAGGARVALPRHGGAPQFGGTSATIELEPLGAAWRPHNPLVYIRPAYLVSYSVFRGRNMPPRVAMHPSRFAQFEATLPAAPELTPIQIEALDVTAGLKSFARLDEFSRKFPAELYQPTRDELAALGLMTKRGAITPAGRNALR